MSYNDLKSWKTMNVTQWIGNDEGLYLAAVDFMRNYSGRSPYRDFINSLGLGNASTPDGVKWLDYGLSMTKLNADMWGYVED